MSNSLHGSARSGRDRSSCLVALLLALFFVTLAREARAQTADNWLGARVMAKTSDTKLKVGSKVSATLNAGSVFRVDRVNGDWLWVDSGNIQGWVKKGDVVLFEQAIAYFTDVIRKDESDEYAHVSRGIAWHQHREHEQAVSDFTEAIRLDPDSDWPYHDRAAAYHALKDYDRALADADEAVTLNPDEPAHLATRASIRFARKEYDLAIADYSEAARMLKGDEASLDDSGEGGEPGQTRGRLSSVTWLSARAECWAAKHVVEKAIADYAEALRLDPRDAATLNSLAWILATCELSSFRDGKKAYELAGRACGMTGYRNHLFLDTLAAAYAESNDFDAAVKWQTQALAIAHGDERFAAGYRARLKLYQDKVPYRENVAP
jgi:tetratricopeptide (TPR) repeat protein